MQDFGSGDTSSNLVGGIQTKSWNLILIFFPPSVVVLVYIYPNYFTI